ncbi:unnamed protein product [Adineta ricciae]|uniref:Uncharacterized protein n=1 Tax=Adineta ricciae TaxID=249248 RepID=A0A814HAK7_ADIRI|nr:unnamed protein product [Adineta ricciae]
MNTATKINEQCSRQMPTRLARFVKALQVDGHDPRLLWLGRFRPVKFAFRRLPYRQKFKRSFQLLSANFELESTGIIPKPTQI